MTNEEAIKILKEIIEEGWLISDLDKCTAIDACEMAIETLEQKSYDEDIISRQKTIEAFINGYVVIVIVKKTILLCLLLE